MGGLINNRLLEHKVAATYVPFAAFVLAFFAADLYFASGIYRIGSPLLGDYLVTLPSFLSYSAAWRIVIDLLMISLAGGLYVVPLKAIIQYRSPPKARARVVAAGSLLDATFILASSLVAIFMLAAGFAIQDLFLFLALGSLGMGLYLRRLAPVRATLRKIFRRQHE
jgi:acyl-[acyl-carrier-protein]-phospholipid O-acyltransferase/long-chain-fatty-acid--[acyl-carrier-protein] ligase